MYGHSAVFHKASNTIYVYGGFTYKSDSWYVSHDLFAYDVAESMWSLLVPEDILIKDMNIQVRTHQKHSVI